MKKIITFIVSLLMLFTIAMPVVAEEGDPYTVTIDYDKGLVITANQGGDIKGFDYVGFGGMTCAFISESNGLVINGNEASISNLYVKKIIESGATANDGKYSVRLYKKGEDNGLVLVYSADLAIYSDKLIRTVNPEKVKYSISTTDYGRVYHNLVVTDETILTENPYYLIVQFDNTPVYYNYSQDSYTYKVDSYSLNSSVSYGTYTPILKIEGYKDYELEPMTVGYKECNLAAEYDTETGEMLVDLSAFEEEERNLIMDIMLSTREEYFEKYSDLDGFYSFSINAITVINDEDYGDDQPVYKKDDTTVAVKSWLIDMAKNPEESKDDNSGWIQLPGYMSYQIPVFTVSSSSLPEGFEAKIVYELDGIYLEVECVTSDIMSKIALLQSYASPLVYMEGGVGVLEETPAQMEAKGVLTYINGHSFRIKLNSNIQQRFNGYQGFEIKVEGYYGKRVGDTARTVVAPNVGKVDSNATTLSDISLVDGWPNISVSKMGANQDRWHWVNARETVAAGTTTEHYAQIEVWDYIDSEHLGTYSKGVDYETICKNLSNVEYVVTEDGHHYLRAKVTVSVPASVGSGIKTSVDNFNPSDTTSTSTRSDINKIKDTAEENNLNQVAYYDIKLDDGATTSLDNETELKVALPKWVVDEPVADGKQRVYNVITVHNGQVRTLNATDNGDGTLSFKSKDFSIFTVTYTDITRGSAGTGGEGGNGSGSVAGSGSGSGNTIVYVPKPKPVVNTAAK